MAPSLKSDKLSAPFAAMVSKALENFASRGDRRLIPRGKKGAESEIPYLYRNFLEGKQAEDSQPGLFLHKFVSSDKEGQLHNHPWKWSVSFILVGRYRETRTTVHKWSKNPTNGKLEIVRFHNPIHRELQAGEVNHISDSDFHRVEILSPHVWTLFLHGPRTGQWGFATENYKRPVKMKFVHKRTYDAQKKVSHAAS